jgi:hypothetical protein
MVVKPEWFTGTQDGVDGGSAQYRSRLCLNVGAVGTIEVVSVYVGALFVENVE